jgi:hypothetical protein
MYNEVKGFIIFVPRMFCVIIQLLAGPCVPLP